MQTDKTTVYISFTSGGESETIAGTLYGLLEQRGFQPRMDKRDLGYKGDIMAFGKLIGAGNYIITIICDKYLKSEHCMQEMLFTHRNGDVGKRIFLVVLKDAQGIYDKSGRLNYQVFWKQGIENFEQQLDQHGFQPGINGSVRDLNRLHNIRRIIGEFLDLLAWMNTTLDISGDKPDFPPC